MLIVVVRCDAIQMTFTNTICVYLRHLPSYNASSTLSVCMINNCIRFFFIIFFYIFLTPSQLTAFDRSVCVPCLFVCVCVSASTIQ